MNFNTRCSYTFFLFSYCIMCYCMCMFFYFSYFYFVLLLIMTLGLCHRFSIFFDFVYVAYSRQTSLCKMNNLLKIILLKLKFISILLVQQNLHHYQPQFTSFQIIRPIILMSLSTANAERHPIQVNISSDVSSEHYI